MDSPSFIQHSAKQDPVRMLEIDEEGSGKSSPEAAIRAVQEAQITIQSPEEAHSPLDSLRKHVLEVIEEHPSTKAHPANFRMIEVTIHGKHLLIARLAHP